MVLAAWIMISRPTSVLPVKAILSTMGLVQISGPTTWPGPVMTLKTPGGNRPVSWMISVSFNRLRGVKVAGLMITVLPAASAGASFQIAIRKGKFHGMIWPQTPIGSLSTML